MIDNKSINKKLSDKEYYGYVKEILENDKFKELKRYKHHGKFSRYEHSINVSYMNYKICKFLKLDYISSARAGLLHDFFFNDLVHRSKRDFFKCKHPQMALNNSLELFSLKDVEKDIIEKHMWPLTFKIPSYKETYVITISDKLCCIKEIILSLRKYKY